MKLVAATGQELSPGALVITRKKSFEFFQSALAAAAAKLASLGFT